MSKLYHCYFYTYFSCMTYTLYLISDSENKREKLVDILLVILSRAWTCITWHSSIHYKEGCITWHSSIHYKEGCITQNMISYSIHWQKNCCTLSITKQEFLKHHTRLRYIDLPNLSMGIYTYFPWTVYIKWLGSCRIGSKDSIGFTYN